MYVGIQQYNKTNFLVENGITTTAVVIDVGKKYVQSPKRGHGKYVAYAPILQYSDLENNKITFTHNVPANSTSIIHEVGDSIQIIYQKNKPYRERENSFQGLYLIPTVGCCMGLLALSIALWGVISIFRNIKMR
ncbi:DUF3592 domain-containing protein [Bernardetia sp. MNP-M8]|uniref:DUF3592 domain-containing protein n=1 Tax=Bernardetia sp. MNP-M8 TaxID=3127470 RepID=UPI0030D1086C